MRIAVIDPDPVDAAISSKALGAAGHEVTTFGTLADFWQTDGTDVATAPRLIVLELASADATAVARLRAHAGPQLYILVLTSQASTATASAAFAAGADDYMRKPLGRGELLARVMKAGRYLALVAAIEPRPPAPSAISQLAAWQSAEQTVCTALSGMTGAPLQVSATAIAGWLPQLTARTRLFSPAHELELALMMSTNPASLTATTRFLLGSTHTDPDVHRDLLVEMANQAGGSVKRQALSEDMTFTLDLPTTLQPSAAAALIDGAEAGKHWFLVDQDRCFEFHAAIRRRAKKQLRVGELREGMVLVGGVHNLTGVLLAAAGTRLTATLIARLGSLVAPDLALEVAYAAA